MGKVRIDKEQIGRTNLKLSSLLRRRAKRDELQEGVRKKGCGKCNNVEDSEDRKETTIRKERKQKSTHTVKNIIFEIIESVVKTSSMEGSMGIKVTNQSNYRTRSRQSKRFEYRRAIPPRWKKGCIYEKEVHYCCCIWRPQNNNLCYDARVMLMKLL